MTEWWRTLVPAGGIVYDVGAHVGDTVADFATTAGHVFACEPNPHCYAELLARTRALGNVTCLPVGLGELAAVREVFVYQFWTLLPRTPVDPRYQERRYCPDHRNELKGDFPVLFLTLDWLRTILPAPAFLKVDVDGMEGRVIRGAQHVLAGDRPLLYLEIARAAMADVGDTPEGLVGLLEGCGYRFLANQGQPVPADGRMLLKILPGGVAGLDVLCVPAERWDAVRQHLELP